MIGRIVSGENQGTGTTDHPVSEPTSTGIIRSIGTVGGNNGTTRNFMQRLLVQSAAAAFPCLTSAPAGSGSSGNACSDVYHGSEPASEPETQV